MALRAEEIEGPGVVDLDRDRSLVLRYQRGDEGAFDDLYRRYYSRLHLYCQRRVGDAHAAEELAQEAFIRALRAMPTFAGERRFYPWMTVIAQRLCIDHHRRTARVEPSADIDLGIVEPDHDALFAAVDHDHLSEAMDRLAPRHREVLDLRERRGWSYVQIAAHLDVPVTTVEALLHRARKALKREFLAVSSGTRLAGMPIVGWLVLRMAHWRARVSGRTASQLAPVAGSAAAGLAAIGLVLTPFGGAFTPPALARPPAVIATQQAAPAARNTAIAVAPAGPSTPGPAASRPSASDAPPPAAVDAGAVKLYSGKAGTQYAQSENAQQPVQVGFGPVQAGVNPEQTIADVATHIPGGIP
ncbi:MAG: polymerase sigma-70 factor, subfamily [Acidimicrobiaceae bacterium]